MSESEADRTFFNFLWFIQGGKILLRSDGLEIFSISRNGPDPEIDIRNIESLRKLIPPLTPLFMEKMRKVSKNLASSDRNIRVTVNGDLFLNMGSRGTILKDMEGFMGMVMKRIKVAKNKSRIK